MSWLDKSCLQLVVRRKDKPETLTFQVSYDPPLLSFLFLFLCCVGVRPNTLITRIFSIPQPLMPPNIC